MELSEHEILDLLRAISARTPKHVAERAMVNLYTGFSLSIRNYFWKNWLQDAETIEEIIQDTFMEVWKHADRFRGEAKFKTWLLGIARNKAVDKLRQNRLATESMDDREEFFEAGDLPVTDLIQQEQVRLGLKHCMDSLSEKGKLSATHCEVLHLAYIEDQDIAEMAQIVGCPENTIKTRLHYARLRIKDCLSRRLRGDHSHD